MSTAKLLIDSRCELAEGPIWHPQSARLFWFDIVEKKLFSATANGADVRTWSFDEHFTAAALVDGEKLVLASESALKLFEIETGALTEIVDIETAMPNNRSNDCRVNRAGGFWVGTMGKTGDKQPNAGSVYQFRAGVLSVVKTPITIPNSICFSPDGTIAYLADTSTKKIMKCTLDTATGLPNGDWSVFVETEGHRGAPDGAVTDAEGYVWSARWGGNCVVRHAPDGAIDQIVEVSASQVSCPAFGGPDMKTLFLTTARENMSDEQLAAEPEAGGIFAINVDVPGLVEPTIKL